MITTGQPSVNPRIVKEADALTAAGYEVLVLYCFWIDWASKADQQLLSNVSWKYKLIGGSPETDKSTFDFTRIRFKIMRSVTQILGNRKLVAERAQARCYDELLTAARNSAGELFIGHNLGALAVVVNAAKLLNARCAFDFEDYHRAENNDMPAREQARIRYLEERYVPQLDFVYAASPMIAQAVKADFPALKIPVQTLLNCFPAAQQPAFRDKDPADNKLQLFWFSQTVGANRGLETLIAAIARMHDKNIHLTLAGKYSEAYAASLREAVGDISANIHFAGIIAPDELASFAASFDVGLAMELNQPLNRDICLTNKIFTCILAGNAIILSRTEMQQSFNEQYKVGQSFAINNVDELIKAISFYKDQQQLYMQRKHNYELAARELNWETESVKLIAMIKDLLPAKD
ncbi:MAG: hypothetical protein JWQ27_164 [Ferruginibacter sp.]|nr:hypothetical protein [Ferruginibacter sp.]